MAANPRVRNYALRVWVDNAFNQGFMSAPEPSAFFLDFHCRMCGAPRTMRFLMGNPRRFEFSGNCSRCNAHFSFSPFQTPALAPGERFYYLISFRITGPLSLDSLEVSDFQVSWTTQLAVGLGGRLHFHTRDETFTVLVGGAPPGAVFEEESDSDDYAEDPESDDDAAMVEVGGVNQGQVADEGGVVLNGVNGVNGVNGANGVNGFPGMHGELVIGSFSIPAPNGVNFDVMVFQPGDVVSQLIGLRLQFHRL